MLAVDVGERAIVTVEAVAGARPFSDVQRALIDAGAIQCGFCTPGFVMALTRALRARPKADARRHSRGDLGQPVPMFRLCENSRSGRASRRGCAVRDPDTAARRSPPRLDAADKATGRARYADDIRLPGMLHAAIHTSQQAHARIVACRTDAARALPGVHAIVTGADIAGTRWGGIVKDETMLARDKVRYVASRSRPSRPSSRDGYPRGRRDRGRLRTTALRAVARCGISLKGDFYFSGSPVEAALPPPPASPAKSVGPARTIDEEVLWKVIESSTNPVDFERSLGIPRQDGSWLLLVSGYAN